MASEQWDSTAEHVVMQEARDETEPYLKMLVSTHSANPFTQHFLRVPRVSLCLPGSVDTQ